MRLPGSCLLFLIFILAPVAAGVGENLVRNDSFEKTGEDPVPEWTVRKVAGLTTFRSEAGRLVAERRPGGGAPDSCVQMVYLPRETRAVRVALRAEVSRLTRAEFVLRLTDRDGRSMERRLLFRFLGTHDARNFEKDVLLPVGTRDAEVAFLVHGEGRLLVDRVSVSAIPPEECRGEARVVRVRSSAWISAEGERLQTGRVSLAVPGPTETQAPIALRIRSSPANRVRSAKLRTEETGARLELEVGPLAPGQRVTLEVETRVVATGWEDFTSLPDPLPITPSRHLGRKVAPFAAPPPEDAALDRFAERARRDTTDLRSLATRTALLLTREIRSTPGGPLEPARVAAERSGAPAGRANLAAAVLRRADVPARAVLLLPVAGGAGGFAVEVFAKKHGWIRMGLSRGAGGPLPFAAHVRLQAAGAEDRGDPGAPIPGPGVQAGPDGDGPRAEETSSAVLERGAAKDVIDSFTRAWSKALRRLGPEGTRVAEKDVTLKGRAKGLANRLPEWLAD